MHSGVGIAFALAILAPLGAALITGLRLLLGDSWLSEAQVARSIRLALLASFAGSAAIGAYHVGLIGSPLGGEVDFGSWVAIGSYEVPAVLYLDHVAVAFSLLGAAMTGLVARFSVTYLHKEAGFARFYVLLGVFASGTQLVAFAGALDLFFAGWEAIGISSALFIGFFHERPEPVRSAVRAFITYRLCDLAFLVAIVTTHEHLGSTRLLDLAGIERLPGTEITIIGLLLLVAALGKSAQLPFSGWLVRAMEGPTPSSALFYGGVSIHCGLFLLLRTAPVLEAAPVAAATGVVIGLLTAIYAAAATRTHADAKGALAQATLAQTGLILAEICLGLTTLALVHLVSHAMLRAWQYLRAPNAIHDAHHYGHHDGPAAPAEELSRLQRAWYLLPLHRFRLEDRLDAVADGAMSLARGAHRLDQRLLALFGAAEDGR
jgi:NADH:ubiquinone oxidoreductase subunit 5 (subunit L)/multisubunit Na+/H+ antiporter MnhA subunit